MSTQFNGFQISKSVKMGAHNLISLEGWQWQERGRAIRNCRSHWEGRLKQEGRELATGREERVRQSSHQRAEAFPGWTPWKAR